MSCIRQYCSISLLLVCLLGVAVACGKKAEPQNTAQPEKEALNDKKNAGKTEPPPKPKKVLEKKKNKSGIFECSIELTAKDKKNTIIKGYGESKRDASEAANNAAVLVAQQGHAAEYWVPMGRYREDVAAFARGQLSLDFGFRSFWGYQFSKPTCESFKLPANDNNNWVATWKNGEESIESTSDNAAVAIEQVRYNACFPKFSDEVKSAFFAFNTVSAKTLKKWQTSWRKAHAEFLNCYQQEPVIAAGPAALSSVVGETYLCKADYTRGYGKKAETNTVFSVSGDQAWARLLTRVEYQNTLYLEALKGANDRVEMAAPDQGYAALAGSLARYLEAIIKDPIPQVKCETIEAPKQLEWKPANEKTVRFCKDKYLAPNKTVARKLSADASFFVAQNEMCFPFWAYSKEMVNGASNDANPDDWHHSDAGTSMAIVENAIDCYLSCRHELGL